MKKLIIFIILIFLSSTYILNIYSISDNKNFKFENGDKVEITLCPEKETNIKVTATNLSQTLSANVTFSTQESWIIIKSPGPYNVPPTQSITIDVTVSSKNLIPQDYIGYIKAKFEWIVTPPSPPVPPSEKILEILLHVTKPTFNIKPDIDEICIPKKGAKTYKFLLENGPCVSNISVLILNKTQAQSLSIKLNYIENFVLTPYQKYEFNLTITTEDFDPPEGKFRLEIRFYEKYGFVGASSLILKVIKFSLEPLSMDLFIPKNGEKEVKIWIENNGKCDLTFDIKLKTNKPIDSTKLSIKFEYEGKPSPFTVKPNEKKEFKVIFTSNNFIPEKDHLLKICFIPKEYQDIEKCVELWLFEEMEEIPTYPSYEIFENPQIFVEEKIKTYGYLIRGENPILLTDYEYYLTNKIMPDGTYIYLKDPENKFPFNPYETYYPEYVELTGFINFDPIYKYTFTITEGELLYYVPITLPKAPIYEYNESPKLKICCNFVIIISGGINNKNNHSRYLSNVLLKYEAVKKLGVPKENIFIFYYDGIIEIKKQDSEDIKKTKSEIKDITLKTSKENIVNCFKKIEEEMKICRKNGISPTLFLFVTDHGDRIDDKDGDETDGKDGVINLLGDEIITDDELKEKICKISKLGKVKGEFSQCYGGEFIDELSNCGNTEVVSASKEDEVSWGADFETIFIEKIMSGNYGKTSSEVSWKKLYEDTEKEDPYSQNGQKVKQSFDCVVKNISVSSNNPEYNRVIFEITKTLEVEDKNGNKSVKNFKYNEVWDYLKTIPIKVGDKICPPSCKSETKLLKETPQYGESEKVEKQGEIIEINENEGYIKLKDEKGNIIKIWPKLDDELKEYKIGDKISLSGTKNLYTGDIISEFITKCKPELFITPKELEFILCTSQCEDKTKDKKIFTITNTGTGPQIEICKLKGSIIKYENNLIKCKDENAFSINPTEFSLFPGESINIEISISSNNLRRQLIDEQGIVKDFVTIPLKIQSNVGEDEVLIKIKIDGPKAKIRLSAYGIVSPSSEFFGTISPKIPSDISISSPDTNNWGPYEINWSGKRDESGDTKIGFLFLITDLSKEKCCKLKTKISLKDNRPILKIYEKEKYIAFTVIVNTKDLNLGKDEFEVEIETNDNECFPPNFTRKGTIKFTFNASFSSYSNIFKSLSLIQNEPKLYIQDDKIEVGKIKESTSKFIYLTIKNIGKGLLNGKVEVEKGEDYILILNDTFSIEENKEEKIIIGIVCEGLNKGFYEGKIKVTSNGGNKEIPIYFEVIPFSPIEIDTQKLTLEMFENEVKNFKINVSNIGAKTYFIKLSYINKPEDVKIICNRANFDIKPGEFISLEFNISSTKYGLKNFQIKLEGEIDQVLIPISLNILRKVKKTIIELFIGKIEAYINGNLYILDAEPYIKPPGRTMVPLRFISEGLGATVDYSPKVGKVQEVYIFYKNKKITLFIGKKEALIDNQKITLDAEAEITKGRTFVPIRFIAETFGAEVKWEAQTKKVTITIEE